MVILLYFVSWVHVVLTGKHFWKTTGFEWGFVLLAFDVACVFMV